MTKGEKADLARLTARIDDQADTIERLEKILPTLEAMADGYKGAAWFGGAIKWLGGVAAAIAAILALIHLSGIDK